MSSPDDSDYIPGFGHIPSSKNIPECKTTEELNEILQSDKFCTLAELNARLSYPMSLKRKIDKLFEFLNEEEIEAMYKNLEVLVEDLKEEKIQEITRMAYHRKILDKHGFNSSYRLSITKHGIWVDELTYCEAEEQYYAELKLYRQNTIIAEYIIQQISEIHPKYHHQLCNIKEDIQFTKYDDTPNEILKSLFRDASEGDPELEECIVKTNVCRSQ